MFWMPNKVTHGRNKESLSQLITMAGTNICFKVFLHGLTSYDDFHIEYSLVRFFFLFHHLQGNPSVLSEQCYCFDNLHRRSLVLYLFYSVLSAKWSGSLLEINCWGVSKWVAVVPCSVHSFSLQRAAQGSETHFAYLGRPTCGFAATWANLWFRICSKRWSTQDSSSVIERRRAEAAIFNQHQNLLLGDVCAFL